MCGCACNCLRTCTVLARRSDTYCVFSFQFHFEKTPVPSPPTFHAGLYPGRRMWRRYDGLGSGLDSGSGSGLGLDSGSGSGLGASTNPEARNKDTPTQNQTQNQTQTQNQKLGDEVIKVALESMEVSALDSSRDLLARALLGLHTHAHTHTYTHAHTRTHPHTHIHTHIHTRTHRRRRGMTRSRRLS